MLTAVVLAAVTLHAHADELRNLADFFRQCDNGRAERIERIADRLDEENENMPTATDVLAVKLHRIQIELESAENKVKQAREEGGASEEELYEIEMRLQEVGEALTAVTREIDRQGNSKNKP